jgi:hypothetical protein
VNGIDLITATGRLLRDGRLRDAFAVAPATVVGALGVREADQSLLLAIAPADLEAQALVLLRKRFGAVRRLLPITCARVGEKAWPLFSKWAREGWPDGEAAGLRDADEYAQRLAVGHPDVICRPEWNRVRFALGSHRLALHWVRELPKPIHKSPCWACQILVRGRAPGWHEFVLFLGL